MKVNCPFCKVDLQYNNWINFFSCRYCTFSLEKISGVIRIKFVDKNFAYVGYCGWITFNKYFDFTIIDSLKNESIQKRRFIIEDLSNVDKISDFFRDIVENQHLT